MAMPGPTRRIPAARTPAAVKSGQRYSRAPRGPMMSGREKQVVAVTYCVAIAVNQGLVLASDSRTNAGVDQVSTYSKMHAFCGDGERMITLLSAGNLATSQAVVRRIRRDMDGDRTPNLKTFQHLAEAAEYVGQLSLGEQQKHAKLADEGFQPGANFILAGQIAGKPQQVFLIYPEGNYIRASRRTPYLQIGELKYGKPILDRIIDPDVDLETAARCALVSMDSTMRSNLSVGPPIELLIYQANTQQFGQHLVLDEDDEYLRSLRHAWEDELKHAFARLPKLPARPARRIRLVEQSGDQ
jgi:putative proteasome-type protease